MHGDGNGADGQTRLYRNRERAMFFGVCAGIADYFGFRLCAVRWLVVIACLFAGWIIVPTYIALAFLLPRKPAALYKDREEEVFWRQVRTAPNATFSHVRHKFREMESQLQRLERYVTSQRFRLDREFQDLERDDHAGRGPAG